MNFAQKISGPIAVIGDVHGQIGALERILDQLRDLPDYQERWIVFIGDLVDRGPDPKSTLETLVQLCEEHPLTTLVCGNHELAMGAALGIIKTPDYCDWSGRWLDHYGCRETFASYGLEIDDLEKLLQVMPQSHRDIFVDIPWSVEHPDYFFVHAGLDPSSSFALQRDILEVRDVTLSRPQWLCSRSITTHEPPRDCRSIVVSGHVRVPSVTFGNRRILVDTTGGEGGSLSCVLLPENKVLHSDPELSRPAGKLSDLVNTPAPAPTGTRKKNWFWSRNS